MGQNADKYLHYETLEMNFGESDRMKLEKIIDEKDLEIKELKEKLRNAPEAITEDEWGEHFSGCENIGETFSMMVKFGFVKEDD